MGNGLMDQLLKAGVVDKKKANRAKQQKRDQAKKGQNKDEAQARAREIERQRKEKAERDRALNRERQQAQEEKARLAQIQQLIEAHRIDRKDAEIPYHFNHGDRIPSILVTEAMRVQLMRDKLRLVLWKEQYELLPRPAADQIMERDASIVVVPDQREMTEEEAQAYEDFPIPDDLMW